MIPSRNIGVPLSEPPVGMDPGYHDRLAQHWPEPREQLHAGGWAATYELVAKLRLQSAAHTLDVCCGEGGTANWLAREFGKPVVGVDLVEEAIRAATRAAGPASPARFVVASVFDLPLADSCFDVIYGQDPDGFAFATRRHAFAECARVLRPGGRLGLQHWLLHDQSPPQHARWYDQTCAEMGFAGMRRLRVGDYLADLSAAGFRDVVAEDMSEVYAKHLTRLEANALRADQRVDPWTAVSLKVIRDGGKIGIRLLAAKT